MRSLPEFIEDFNATVTALLQGLVLDIHMEYLEFD